MSSGSGHMSQQASFKYFFIKKAKGMRAVQYTTPVHLIFLEERILENSRRIIGEKRDEIEVVQKLM